MPENWDTFARVNIYRDFFARYPQSLKELRFVLYQEHVKGEADLESSSLNDSSVKA